MNLHRRRLKSIKPWIETASVAAKMKRLNIDRRQVDNNRDSADSMLLSSFELPEDLHVEEQLRVFGCPLLAVLFLIIK
ncbi:MAG: hypothetical protein ABIH92_00385 [Nanoarchaeota archaeon]